MQLLEHAFENAAANVRPAKTGPDNQMLELFVWWVCNWFENNGLGSRISAGEESHSVKVFIKDIFSEFGYLAPDRALADAIRSCQKKRG
jgi:hypothetical protein